MEKISIDFIYEFAKDLKKLLETIENKGNYSVFHGKDVIIQKIIEDSSNLVEELFEKYKNILDLKICKIDGKCNLEFINSLNKNILIPEDLFKSINYFEFKDNFDVLLILMRNINFNWEDFSFSFTRLISYSNNIISTLNPNTLEKIRFFMSLVNYFPSYITETELPLDTKTKIYYPLHSSWGRSKIFS